MTDHQDLYNKFAENYDPLIMYEDYQGNLLKGLSKITDWPGKDVVETGAGTGRFTCLLAPIVRSIRAYDRESAMIEIARTKLQQMGVSNWELGTADHRHLPVPDHSADIVISGWSVCYFADWDPDNWRNQVHDTLIEMSRILRPGGMIILVETQGTGFSKPHPPAHLLEYFQYLEDAGFQMDWIRTDYRFPSVKDAVEKTRFFFGEQMAQEVAGRNSEILPECTGIWYKGVP